MNIQDLRAQRNQSLSKITAQFEAEANPKSYEDNRFWKPERDKAGNATATIRFLNATEGDELPWAKVFSHGFKGPSGRWYIENSLSTLGKPDPVGEMNMKLWNSTTDDKSPARDQARRQKRKLNYISNILVVNDPKHPENNGQVKLFKYGKKIFDKIMDKARPTFEDEEPVNVFDYWEGANFKLRMKTVENFPNYDSSEFESPSPVCADDDDLLEVVNAQYKLSEFTSEANFKSYDELKTKLALVMAGSTDDWANQTAEDVANDPEPVVAAPSPGKTKAAKAPKSKAPKVTEAGDDDEDMMSYFKSIANED